MSFYPSKSGSPLGHHVERTITGFTCSCGYNCWAIGKERAKDQLDELLKRKVSDPEFILPDFQIKQEEQIEYARRPIYQPTLDDLRRAEQASRKLCEVSAAQYKERKLAAYYLRFA